MGQVVAQEAEDHPQEIQGGDDGGEAPDAAQGRLVHPPRHQARRHTVPRPQDPSRPLPLQPLRPRPRPWPWPTPDTAAPDTANGKGRVASVAADDTPDDTPDDTRPVAVAESVNVHDTPDGAAAAAATRGATRPTAQTATRATAHANPDTQGVSRQSATHATARATARAATRGTAHLYITITKAKICECAHTNGGATRQPHAHTARTRRAKRARDPNPLRSLAAPRLHATTFLRPRPGLGSVRGVGGCLLLNVAKKWPRLVQPIRKFRTFAPETKHYRHG